MKHILLIQAILELIAGILLILMPSLLLWDQPMDTIAYNLSKMYGIAAVIIGTFSYLIYRYVESYELLKRAALTSIGFHIFLSFHLYGMYNAGILTHHGVFGLHLFVALSFLFLYLRNIKTS